LKISQRKIKFTKKKLEKLQPVYAKWTFFLYINLKEGFKKLRHFEVVKFRGYLSSIASAIFKFRGTVLQQTNAYWHCWLTQ